MKISLKMKLKKSCLKWSQVLRIHSVRYVFMLCMSFSNCLLLQIKEALKHKQEYLKSIKL